MPTEKQCLVIGHNTYGYYYPKTGMFECTHGAWSSRIKLIDDENCIVYEIDRQKPRTYKVLDEIPEDYIY